MRLSFVCVCLAAFVCSSQGEKQCYSCLWHVDKQLCLTNPDAVNPGKVPCPMKYCTIRRMEYAQEPGKVYSFYRGCEDSPEHTNALIPSDTYNVYYRACTTNLCNYGDGIKEFSSGSGSPGFGSGGENIIVLGRDSASRIRDHSQLLAVLLPLLAFVMNRLAY